MGDFDPVPECTDLLDVVKEARVRYEEAHRRYDELAAPLQGRTVVVTKDEAPMIDAVERAAEQATDAHNAWVEALKPWLECMKMHMPRR